MRRNFLVIITASFSSIFAFIAFFLYFLFVPVVADTPGKIYYLKPGTSLNSFTTQMDQQGIITHSSLFRLYAYLQGNAVLKSGEYLFAKGATPASIWSQVTHGTGLAYHPFTIIPGWTFTQLRKGLEQTEGLKHLINTMDDQQIMTQMGEPTVKPEGEFYPETYYFTRGDSDLVLLRRAHDLMQNRLRDAWASRVSGLPYKMPYEVLIVASLIEKEAYLDSERPLISGVVLNRLRTNMLLQMDPTVIYGMGTRYTGKIHKSDLTTDTVYNTYVHKGLPPSPIAIPSQSSLNAAIHPQPSDYFYFVAKGDGSHQFSHTLYEHNAAVTAIIHQNNFFNDLQHNEHLQDLLELYNDPQQVH